MCPLSYFSSFSLCLLIGLMDHYRIPKSYTLRLQELWDLWFIGFILCFSRYFDKLTKEFQKAMEDKYSWLIHGASCCSCRFFSSSLYFAVLCKPSLLHFKTLISSPTSHCLSPLSLELPPKTVHQYPLLFLFLATETMPLDVVPLQWPIIGEVLRPFSL